MGGGPGDSGVQVLKAGNRVNLGNIDLAERVSGRSYSDEAWPNRFSGAQIYRVDNAVEGDDVDVVLRVDSEDSGEAQER